MLRVSNLYKTFSTASGKVEAVTNVNFEVDRGQFFTLLGPSGCGKTTTLRCIAGLESPDAGEIWVGDDAVCVINETRRMIVPAHKRGMGMVFQSYAIWPHMSVFRNVAFPLLHGESRFSKAEIAEKVRRALKLVQLEDFEDRPSPFLSGGQQQRVALARALAYEPKLLLLDEPLSNLDFKLRLEMRRELRELTDRLQITTLYVTHDQEEALALSDRIALMHHGQITEQGEPYKMYGRPSNLLTAATIGNINRLLGQVAQVTKDGLYSVSTGLGNIACILPQELKGVEKVVVAFRPEDIVLHTDSCSRAVNFWSGTVEHILYVGKRVEVSVRVGKELVYCESIPRVSLTKGQTIAFEIEPERVLVFPADKDSGGSLWQKT